MPSKEKDTTRTEVANAVELAKVALDIQYLKSAMDDVKKLISELKNDYATKEEARALAERVRVVEVVTEANNKWIEAVKAQLSLTKYFLGFFGLTNMILIIKFVLDLTNK